MLVVAVSPFERAMPGSIFGFTLTTVEVAIVIALAAGAAAWFRRPAVVRVAHADHAAARGDRRVRGDRRHRSLRNFAATPFASPRRLAVAAMLFVLVANVARSDRIARQIVAALLAAAAVVGAIAILELAQLPWVLNALTAFRPGFHVVGGQLRATSTLFYPTITSMFLEVAFALGLIWLASSRLAFAALVLTGAGVIATFTRSGLITITLSLALYGGVLFVRAQAMGRRAHGAWRFWPPCSSRWCSCRARRRCSSRG